MKSHYVHQFEGFDLIQIPTLRDNYTYVIKTSSAVAVIDPGEAGKVVKTCEQLGLKPTHIINTHHHWDHTDGNLELKEKFSCEIWGPEGDAKKIKGLTRSLKEGPLVFGGEEIQVYTAPGHTMGHMLLHFPKQKVLFTGDVLFCGGCGRVFEGTHQEMFASLQKIKALPSDTLIFCGHEYSLKNLEFAEASGITVDSTREKWKTQISNGMPTVPSTLETELKINPFLRAESAAEFSKLREQKDKF
jgi:hydroxyacylglutathione hydrolase